MKGKTIGSLVLVLSLFAVGLVVLSTETRSAEASSTSSETWEREGSYEITDRSLSRLKEKEVPEEIIAKLAGLREQKYTGEKDFLAALENAIGKEHTDLYTLQILRAAWYYNPQDRREPFEELIKSSTPTPELTPGPTGSCPPPLGEFEVKEIRVIGIILGESGDRARVLAPDGKSYTLITGTCIGQFNGRVLSFSDNCVTVKETKRFQEGDKTIDKEPETQLCINPREEEKTP